MPLFTPPVISPSQNFYRSGYYYTTNDTDFGTTVTMTEAREYCTPIWIGAAMAVSAISVEVTTIASSSGKLRLGIRAGQTGANADLPSATVVVDGGVVSATCATGELGVSGLSTPLSPGLYWLSATAQGASGGPVTVRAINTNNNPMPLPIPSVATGAVQGQFQATITGALPSTFTWGNSVATVPRIYIKAV